MEQGNEASLRLRVEQIQQEKPEVNGSETKDTKRKEEGTLYKFQKAAKRIGQSIGDKQRGRRMTGAGRFLRT